MSEATSSAGAHPSGVGADARTAPSSPVLRVAALTHPGLVHPKNEDSHAVVQPVPGQPSATLLLVCDGMGGMGRGDLASQMAVAELERAVLASAAPGPFDKLKEAITAADEAVRRALCTTGEGFAGSTAVLAWIDGPRAWVAWAGDSRVYHVRARRVIARTKDHKLIQELVDSGQLTADEARRTSLSSVITRALGGRPPGTPAVVPAAFDAPWELAPGDRVVLCSDGLCDLVDDDELAELLDGKAPEEACDDLVAKALERGGHDNITVVVALYDDPKRTPKPARRRATPMPAVTRQMTGPEPAGAAIGPLLAAIAVLGILTWFFVHWMRVG